MAKKKTIKKKPAKKKVMRKKPTQKKKVMKKKPIQKKKVMRKKPTQKKKVMEKKSVQKKKVMRKGTLTQFPETVRNLFKKGREQGFVTEQELLDAVPDLESNVELLDAIYDIFLDRGIEVKDSKSAMWGESISKKE